MKKADIERLREKYRGRVIVEPEKARILSAHLVGSVLENHRPSSLLDLVTAYAASDGIEKEVVLGQLGTALARRAQG